MTVEAHIYFNTGSLLLLNIISHIINPSLFFFFAMWL